MRRTRLGHPGRLWTALALAAAAAFLLALPAAARAVTVQTFPVPSGAANLSDIVAGPDGALWFTETGANKVGRITTAGQITEYPVPNLASGLQDTGPTQIVSSGGALWFLTDIGESVYRMATSGAFTRVFDDSFYEPARHAKTVQLARGSAVLHHRGRVSITLHLARHVLAVLARAHNPVKVTITGVSSAAGTQSRTVERSLLLRP